MVTDRWPSKNAENQGNLMSSDRNFAWLCGTLLGLIAATSAQADPCGMVPPIYTGDGQPITRIGEQKTYVFYKDGIETFVIRPGFSGKVDEFGMLIPFPAPPAVRKVPDHIFPHVAAAIDPPEVVIDMRWALARKSKQSFSRSNVLANRNQGQGLKYDEVRVVRQEAVGMYEVAVLEAGSPAALKKWMDQHGYKYPDGMDSACQEYVEDRWCFVAVKTKVGQKGGADPQPAQREVDVKLPSGSTFDGHVQAMAFRFPSDELVVPMRLASFNAGGLRNIVYLLTDKPQKINSIPEEYVVRQVSGEDLHKNLTSPLPLRVIGGTPQTLPDHFRTGLDERRNPVPHNGAAKDLFAADLLAVASDKLSLPHEEREKDLLAIGERLGLRGKEIDTLHETALSKEREKTIAGALQDVKDMTLTVVDGDFPREVLARKNLRFGEYTMPSRRNTAESYDAKTNGPAGRREGVLHLGALPPRTHQPAAETVGASPTSVAALDIAKVSLMLGSLSLALCGALVWSLRR